jgi:hypothetical protein
MLYSACYLYTNRFGTPATVLAASVYPLLAMFFVMTFILTVTTPDVDTLVTVRKTQAEYENFRKTKTAWAHLHDPHPD